MGSKIEKRIDIKVTQTGVKELKATSGLVKTLLSNIENLTGKIDKFGKSMAKSVSAIRSQSQQFKSSTNDINKYQKALDNVLAAYEKLAKQKLPEIKQPKSAPVVKAGSAKPREQLSGQSKQLREQLTLTFFGKRSDKKQPSKNIKPDAAKDPVIEAFEKAANRKTGGINKESKWAKEQKAKLEIDVKKKSAPKKPELKPLPRPEEKQPEKPNPTKSKKSVKTTVEIKPIEAPSEQKKEETRKKITRKSTRKKSTYTPVRETSPTRPDERIATSRTAIPNKPEIHQFIPKKGPTLYTKLDPLAKKDVPKKPVKETPAEKKSVKSTPSTRRPGFSYRDEPYRDKFLDEEYFKAYFKNIRQFAAELKGLKEPLNDLLELSPKELLQARRDAIEYDLKQLKNLQDNTKADNRKSDNYKKRARQIAVGKDEIRDIERQIAQIDRNAKQEVFAAQQAQLRKRQESQDFWAQKVWQGYNPIANIWNRVKPSSLLENYVGQKRMEAAKAQATAFEKRDFVTAKQAEFAKIKAEGGKISEAEEAEVAMAEKAAASSEAAAGAASGAASAASGALTVIAVIAKIAKQFLAGWKAATRAVTGMSFSVKDNFMDVMQNVSKITDMYSGMATYAANTSLIMNSGARETQLKYGLTGAQAYAFDKTRDLLGVKSDEDLAYMNASQRAVFQTYLQKQEQWYNKLEQSGMLQQIQQMQLDFSMFKEEVAAEFLGWVAENKDTIMSALKLGVTVMKALLEGVMKLLTFFGMKTDNATFGIGSTALSDTVGTTKIQSTQNKTVNINSTFNASGVISSQDAMQAWYEDNFNRQLQETATSLGDGN